MLAPRIRVEPEKPTLPGETQQQIMTINVSDDPVVFPPLLITPSRTSAAKLQIDVKNRKKKKR
jgi:hypothetical protein